LGLASAPEWVFWLLYGVVILVLLAYGFVMLANLVGSPFYGYLSELAEKEVRGSGRNWMKAGARFSGKFQEPSA